MIEISQADADVIGVDVFGVRVAEGGEDVQGVQPVATGWVGVAEGKVRRGEAVMGAGLISGLVELIGEILLVATPCGGGVQPRRRSALWPVGWGHQHINGMVWLWVSSNSALD